MELDMFSEVEPTPLNFCLAVKNKKKAGMLPLAWFFQIVKRSAILWGFRVMDLKRSS
jgi:hypothetical protein